MVYVLRVIAECVGCIIMSLQEHFIITIPLHHLLPAHAHKLFAVIFYVFVKCPMTETHIRAQAHTHNTHTATPLLLSHVQLTICFPTLTCSDLWSLCKQAYHPNPSIGKNSWSYSEIMIAVYLGQRLKAAFLLLMRLSGTDDFSQWFMVFPQNSRCDKIKGGSIYFRNVFCLSTLPVKYLCVATCSHWECKGTQFCARTSPKVKTFWHCFLSKGSCAKISFSEPG